MVFLLVCFWDFNGFVVCFLCVWHSCKSAKNACFCFFPNCLGFWATSLGPKPSLILFIIFLFFGVFSLVSFLCFPFIAFTWNPPPLRSHFLLFIFLCFPLFLFCLVWPPPFSLSLSSSLSCPFLSSLIIVSHVNFWFLLFVSRCSFVFAFLLVVLFYFESQS